MWREEGGKEEEEERGLGGVLGNSEAGGFLIETSWADCPWMADVRAPAEIQAKPLSSSSEFSNSL